MLRDVILRAGQEIPVRLLCASCQHLGERTGDWLKENCGENSAMLPVYRCEIYRFCSPWGQSVDDDLVKPCFEPLCNEYQPCLPLTNTG